MSEHTPGPWQDFAGVIWAPGQLGRIGLATHEADARLIAAAPDLLAACEMMRDFWSNPDSVVEIPAIIHAVKAATTRARGEIPA